MKVLPFTIPKPKDDAIIVQVDSQPRFYDVLHRHKEIQISYIERGSGTIIVGDFVGHFNPEDIFVIGSSVPHVFRSDTTKDENAKMLSIFLTQESFGSHFFETKELKSTAKFFFKSQAGFQLLTKVEDAEKLIKGIVASKNLNRFLQTIQLLHLLGHSKVRLLSSFIAEKRFSENEGKRMNSIFNYSMENFRSKITLGEIAAQASMTPTAFCKYFKKRTRKTYSQFLNEIRIEAVVRILAEASETSIAEAAELSGFQNMSHFHRKFRELKGKTPQQYRNSLTN